MWCKWCRRHVPQKRLTASGSIGCARCGRQLSPASSTVVQAAASSGGADQPPDPEAFGAPPAALESYDDWELDQNVRWLQAKVGAWHRRDDARPGPSQTPSTEPTPNRHALSSRHDRRDHPHAGPQSPHRSKPRAERPSSRLAGCLLFFGLMAFTCGAALLVSSALEQRQDLWTLGVPITISGQVGLLLGLALQLRRIWRISRHAAQDRRHADAQLHELARLESQEKMVRLTATDAFVSPRLPTPAPGQWPPF